MEFDEFAREQLPGLSRFVAAFTGDRQLAQDVTQDTLMRAYLKWPRVRAADRPDLYLRRMAVNSFRSWHSRWYQRSVRPVEQPDPGAETTDPLAQVADRAELVALLAGLGRQQRAAIVLRFFEDRDDAEIAEVLGCSPGTVRGYVSRGLATLRIRIQEDSETQLIKEVPAS